MVNFKLIATKLGEGLKYDTTLNEIGRISAALFDFEMKEFPNPSITSGRSQKIYNWVMTIAEQKIDDKTKHSLLEEFIRQLTPADSPLRNLTKTTEPEASTAFWTNIHPEIIRVARNQFEDGYYAVAVESAMKEVNDRVKCYIKNKIGEELDGAKLMYRAFSSDKPIIVLGDLSTESGRNMQQGYMQIFAGSIIGIRNPKAHANITISEQRAIHFLFVASLLMYKLDECEVT